MGWGMQGHSQDQCRVLYWSTHFRVHGEWHIVAASSSSSSKQQQHKNGYFQPVFRTIILKVPDDDQCVAQACVIQAFLAVSVEGCSSSGVLGLRNDCKWVFNEVSLTPWCHVVVHFNLDQEKHTDPARS